MKWIEVGFKILPLILTAVTQVEKFVKGKGKEKQDAAVDMVKAMLEAIEGAAGKDLLDDADVQKATRAAIDAIVALENVLAKKKAEQKAA